MAYVPGLPGAIHCANGHSDVAITLRNWEMLVNTTVLHHLTGFRRQMFLSARADECTICADERAIRYFYKFSIVSQIPNYKIL